MAITKLQWYGQAGDIVVEAGCYTRFESKRTQGFPVVRLFSMELLYKFLHKINNNLAKSITIRNE